jgi:type I restriction enzyme S subunit
MGLPQGWTIAKMTDIVEWSSGGTPRANNPEYYGGTIPWAIIGDLNDSVVTKTEKSITESGLYSSSAKYVDKGSILLAMYGSIGKLGIAGIQLTTNQAIAFTKTMKGLSNKYLFYYLYLQKSYLLSLGKGGTQKNISQTVINSLTMPLPPLTEQKRIVEKIDALFSELDKGVEVLQTIRQQLRMYRQAVLKWAFEGKLTDSKPLSEELLGQHIEKPRYGTAKKCYPEINGTAVYRIPNIDFENGIISHEDLKYAEFTDDELSPLHLVENDILMIRSNGSVSLVGRAAIIREADMHGAFAGYLIRLRLSSKRLLPRFLLHYLQSPNARLYIERVAKSTSGVNNINSGEISKLPITFFDTDEQLKIVAEIESRLSVCDNLIQIVDENIAKSQALRQSILKKAFAGQLVPQDPNDEPAEKLLERIKAAKPQANSKRRKKNAEHN